MDAIRQGACIVTDTQMGRSGINKRALARYGGEVYCFMSDEDVAATAKANGTTRATASMDKAAQLDKPLIFAIGNAPTALVRLYELIEEGKLNPALIGRIRQRGTVQRTDHESGCPIYRGTGKKRRKQYRSMHLQCIIVYDR